MRTAQHTRRRAANLYEEFTDRIQIEHGVEGGDFVNTDIWHIELVRDRLHHWNRDPAFLFLATPQKWNHAGRLAPFGIFFNLLIAPALVFI